jgi:hypothetical protein
MYHMVLQSIKVQDFLYGNMWKLLAKMLGVVHTNGDAMNSIISEITYTLG